MEGVVTMKEYQKKVKPVKFGAPAQLITVENDNAAEASTIKVINSARLMEIAEISLEEMVVEIGLEAMIQLFEQDVEELAGPKGKHSKDRTAYRHGTEQTKVTLGDKKISVQKPRVRSNGHDVQLPSLPYFQNESALNRNIVTRLLCGISTRKYSRTVAESGGDGYTISKSEVSRRYNVELTRLMDVFFNRRLNEAFPVIMIDGIEKGGMTIIAALGINDDGKKQVLGLVEGATENSDAVKTLLNDLIERGLRTDVPRLIPLH
jgi:transposase-like protein